MSNAISYNHYYCNACMCWFSSVGGCTNCGSEEFVDTEENENEVAAD